MNRNMIARELFKAARELVSAKTFKCPDCGTKVLEDTGYCVKCKKKVKKASRGMTHAIDLLREEGLNVMGSGRNKLRFKNPSDAEMGMMILRDEGFNARLSGNTVVVASRGRRAERIRSARYKFPQQVKRDMQELAKAVSELDEMDSLAADDGLGVLKSLGKELKKVEQSVQFASSDKSWKFPRMVGVDMKDLAVSLKEISDDPDSVDIYADEARNALKDLQREMDSVEKTIGFFFQGAERVASRGNLTRRMKAGNMADFTVHADRVEGEDGSDIERVSLNIYGNRTVVYTDGPIGSDVYKDCFEACKKIIKRGAR